MRGAISTRMEKSMTGYMPSMPSFPAVPELTNPPRFVSGRSLGRRKCLTEISAVWAYNPLNVLSHL
jgi:hypothetical protein